MKKIIFSMLALSLIAGGAFCQKKIDIEKEKEAIIAVIEKQHNAFLERDYDAIVSTYIQDEQVIRYTANKSGYHYGVYDDVSPYKRIFEENPTPRSYTSQFKNYNIKVYTECAWAAFDIHKSNGDHSIEVRFLEKVDGEWKIVFFSFIDASSYDEEETKSEE
jgi:hypothetical protein